MGEHWQTGPDGGGISGVVRQFRFSGRRGRISTLLGWLLCVVLGVAQFIMTDVLNVTLPAAIVDRVVPGMSVGFIVVIWWIVFAITAQRLHDMGYSGWWQSLPILVAFAAGLLFGLKGDGPIVGVVIGFGWWLALLIAPGERGPNRYGAPPGHPGKATIVKEEGK